MQMPERTPLEGGVLDMRMVGAGGYARVEGTACAAAACCVMQRAECCVMVYAEFCVMLIGV